MKSNRKWWLDEPRNRDKLYYALWAVCVLIIIPDLFYDKHTYHEFEAWFGFYAIFGFVACVALILLAKQLRKLLKRPEDYYDR
ncbi:MAG: hypothetical protein DWQ09_12735 [Proteobacteria bacterium]|nr:MAG: hypothetical protein DWQ09_12735 [Pseudomonadota bacterium]